MFIAALVLLMSFIRLFAVPTEISSTHNAVNMSAALIFFYKDLAARAGFAE
jgi:hypothetical protein